MKQGCSIDHNLDSIFLRQATGRESSLGLTRSINVLPIGIGSIKTVLEKKKATNSIDRESFLYNVPPPPPPPLHCVVLSTTPARYQYECTFFSARQLAVTRYCAVFKQHNVQLVFFIGFVFETSRCLSRFYAGTIMFNRWGLSGEDFLFFLNACV